ncbi:hypothetical protein J6590_041199, partial [Homalodisca vitripennis]
QRKIVEFYYDINTGGLLRSSTGCWDVRGGVVAKYHYCNSKPITHQRLDISRPLLRAHDAVC